MAGFQPTEQHLRNCMLYEFNQKHSAAEATRRINSVYEKALDQRKVRRWFVEFKNGNFELDDAPRSGRPLTINNQVLRNLVEKDPRLTVDEIAKKMGAPRSTVFDHLKSIGKRSLEGKWVPHFLSETNKMQRISICKSLLIQHEKDSFIHRIITGDEKWIQHDNPKRKKQWLSLGDSPKPTPKRKMHEKKTLLCVWWNIHGIVHYELLKPCQTITANVYCEQLSRLKDAIQLKHPALINRKGVILQQDNARPHTAKLTQQKIREFGWDVLSHPPYSPDIAPSDYHLFRSMQHFLAGKKFENQNAIGDAMIEFFNSKDETFYKNGIQNLVSRWQQVIEADGEYVND